ncbi:restriction endonuclease [Pectobacterium aroidearum]|uniref:restriction endonuclease n=1 Tax=Pectobacterium aroidearum TaxID=1201031 RepID=UPI0033146F0B
MKIEVAVDSSSTTKERGDLLEKISEKLLSAQSYNVIKEIRQTAVELDLLCKNKINGKEIYVECKAYRSNIDANILKNLLGTLQFMDYSEAWLISTGEFGKEAKGFIEQWKKKPIEQASRLSFFEPSQLIESLILSGIIKKPPEEKAAEYLGSSNLIGEWILMFTKFGEFWSASILSGGIPSGAICYYASNNELVEDEGLLAKISETDSSFNSLSFSSPAKFKHYKVDSNQLPLEGVVEVQTGQTWSDYRPARPEDFVGRAKDINHIFDFFKKIKDGETSTRIFAITGNSGMGKSSLIAKIRDRANNIQNKKKYFIFPVDVRAAIGPNYIYSSVLQALKIAQMRGFGDQHINLMVSNVSHPLSSESIRLFIESLTEKKQLICVVFDQFEELYSKQELFDVFERAKELLLNSAALKLNFCLGFAWKTDSTTLSEHPAYFFWHQLSDYRITRKLSPFTDGESSAAINIFEKEINQKLHMDLKHNLIVSSQGYPWLLKKLCIHLYEKILNGVAQKDLLENKLDASSLFKEDMDELIPAEITCLKLIAQRAPADWFEIMELSSPSTLESLINKRFVIRSGDRLNIYWDIFREYILTSNVPVIALRYLPSTEFASIYKVAIHLEHAKKLSVQELVAKTKLSDGTIQNIGTDLITLGVAVREAGLYSLSSDIKECNEITVLRLIRDKFSRHALTLSLKEKAAPVTLGSLLEIIKQIYPNNSYADKTWRTYTIRLCRWLEQCGLIVTSGGGWVYRDQGDASIDVVNIRRRRKNSVFTGPASPDLVLETLGWALRKMELFRAEEKPKGYRNALAVLQRFEIILVEKDRLIVNKDKLAKYSNHEEAIWMAAKAEHTLNDVAKLLSNDPTLTGTLIGQYIATKNYLKWTEASKMRNGSAIKKWVLWINKKR